MRALLAGCMGFALLFSVDSARATEPDERVADELRLTLESTQPAEPRERPLEWYGWQSLLGDLAAIGIFAGVPFYGSAGGPVALIDWPILLVIGPAVHHAHGRDWAGWLSLGLRLTTPLWAVPAGMAVGVALQGPCTGWFCGLDGLGWGAYGGFLAGFGLVALVDGFALGWARERAPARPSTEVSWTIVPTASARGGGLSFAGSF